MSTSCAVANTLSVLRRLGSLLRLEWTFDNDQIPFSRHMLSNEDIEQTGLFEEQQEESVTVAKLQLFLCQCIPEVNVQVKVCDF